MATPPNWFMRHRQEFIRGHLRTFGQIRRTDICTKFDITPQVASGDIARFVKDYPDALIYDDRAKCYVLDKEVL